MRCQLPKLASQPFRPRNAMKDHCLSTLDVAGSIPVSRSASQELRALSIPADSVNFQLHKSRSGGVLTLRISSSADLLTKYFSP